MKTPLATVLCLSVLLGAATAGRAVAQQSEVPYDDKLMRLAEILGSLHYLRTLCGEDDKPWRSDMQALLEAENPDPERKAKLAARFNHGYRSFWSVHVQCTDTAVAAIDRYMAEGAKLSGEIIARYGD